MSLGRRLVLTNLAIAMLVVVSGCLTLLVVRELQQDLEVAFEEYQEVGVVVEAEARLVDLISLLSDGRSRTTDITTAVDAVIATARRLSDLQEIDDLESHKDAEHARRESEAIGELLAGLDSLSEEIPEDSPLDRTRREKLTAIAREILPSIRTLSGETYRMVRQARYDASAKATLTIWVLAGLVLTAAVVVILIGAASHRAIMTPLRRLRRGVRHVAGGRFDKPVRCEGVAEFTELAEEFNRMALELAALYEHMEEKIAMKSKELVRSERLASVGYLAAGVAHEINNPLGIISTYAELSLAGLDGCGTDETIDDTRRSLKIIHEEAHRCNAITDKLLSLSRRGEDSRKPVSLSHIAVSVATTIGGLRRFGDRQLSLDLPEGQALEVIANETEMHQLLLNLVVNALEAVRGESGVVTIRGRSQMRRVVFEVADNGDGMDARTLERVFEPFYTTRHGDGQGGVGLGLSICHAIVEAHGGRIHAHSDGPGCGSRFTIDLPAARGAAREHTLVGQ